MFERTISTITWTFTLLLALAFVGDGLAKLGAQPFMVQELRALGYAPGLMYLTGTVEVACALLVPFPRLAHVCAGILACLSAGASYAAFAHGQTSLSVSPLLLLILALAVGTLRGWGRRDPFAWCAAIDRR